MNKRILQRLDLPFYNNNIHGYKRFIKIKKMIKKKEKLNYKVR